MEEWYNVQSLLLFEHSRIVSFFQMFWGRT
jgi:hypothetical protein